jgi:site-specific recombinase XerC
MFTSGRSLQLMRKHNPENERVKREYFTFLERRKKMSPDSVDKVAAAISFFERHTRHRSFRKFHRNQAVAFQASLQTLNSDVTGRPLSKSTIYSLLRAMKAFVQWLQGQPGFRSRISYGDWEYFNASANDERVAKAKREGPVPSLDQIKAALELMPDGSVIQRRDRAVVAFTLLSGARDNAVASFAIRHVNVELRTVFQDARTVRTKNAKTFVSSFFPG